MHLINEYTGLVLTYELQSLWDPGQQVGPQGVVNGDSKVSGAGQEGGSGAAAAHTQHIGDTQRGQPVLQTQTKYSEIKSKAETFCNAL